MSETPAKAGKFGEIAPAVYYCSFCMKSQHEVKKLIAGPGNIGICNECVALCGVVVSGGTLDSSHYMAPEKLPTERLVGQLPAIEATMRGKGSQLQWTVDLLRKRKISWAVIGESLGMSRQSAWERFS